MYNVVQIDKGEPPSYARANDALRLLEPASHVPWMACKGSFKCLTCKRNLSYPERLCRFQFSIIQNCRQNVDNLSASCTESRHMCIHGFWFTHFRVIYLALLNWFKNVIISPFCLQMQRAIFILTAWVHEAHSSLFVTFHVLQIAFICPSWILQILTGHTSSKVVPTRGSAIRPVPNVHCPYGWLRKAYAEFPGSCCGASHRC